MPLFCRGSGIRTHDPTPKEKTHPLIISVLNKEKIFLQSLCISLQAYISLLAILITLYSSKISFSFMIVSEYKTFKGSKIISLVSLL